MMQWLVILALLVPTAVILIWPLWRHTEHPLPTGVDGMLEDSDQERHEEKKRLRANLRTLRVDHAEGKLPQEDYRQLEAGYQQQLAAVLDGGEHIRTATKVAPGAALHRLGSVALLVLVSASSLLLFILYWKTVPDMQQPQVPDIDAMIQTGMLSYQAMGFSHRGHRERGRTTERLAGRRTMQTLRKLPTIRPKIPAMIVTRLSSVTPHLVEEDSRRHRHLQGFHAGASGMASRRLASRPSSWRTPAPSFPRTSATGTVGRCPPGRSPSLSVIESEAPTRFAQARHSASVAETAGSRNSAPIEPRSTFGFVSSAVPLRAMSPLAPSPSAVRAIAPTLPGSCTPSRTTTTSPARGVSWSSVHEGGAITAITLPSGVLVNYTAPVVTITDPTGTGAAATANFNQATLTGGLRKFVENVALLGPAGANNLGQYIPVAVADNTTYPGSDYYEIALVEYTEKIHTALPPTRLRGYVQLSTSAVQG